MHYFFILLFLLASACYAQDPEAFNARSANDVAESLLLEIELPSSAEEERVAIAIDDIDDVTARIAITEDIEFYAGTENMFNIEMFVDPYDEDQLTDITPAAIDEVYPVEGSSRSILAGIQFFF